MLLAASCDSDRIVAQVDDSTLKESDALVLMEHLGYKTNDKKEMNEFLKLWCEQEVSLLELKKNHPNKAKLVAMRTHAYSGELSNFYLEELAIAHSLDSNITENEYKKYYSLHKEEFNLQDYLVKALYIKLPKNKKIEGQLESFYLLKNDKDVSRVNSFAKLYAENFYFDDAAWIYFTDLTKDIPFKGFNIDNIVLNRTKTHFSDDKFTYFLNIIDYKLKDSAPPFEFLKPQIKEIILAKRVQATRQKISLALKRNIYKHHDVKINL